MNIQFQNCKKILGRFLEPKGINYPREIKISKKLINIYPFEFWISCKEPFFPLKMKSLAWFLGEEGKSYLTFHYFEYLKQSTNLSKEIKEVKLEKEKIGEDLIIKKESKSLRDFLGMFKKLEEFNNAEKVQNAVNSCPKSVKFEDAKIQAESFK